MRRRACPRRARRLEAAPALPFTAGVRDCCASRRGVHVHVDLFGTLLVIPTLLSDDDVIKIVPWATIAVVAQICS